MKSKMTKVIALLAAICGLQVFGNIVTDQRSYDGVGRTFYVQSDTESFDTSSYTDTKYDISPETAGGNYTITQLTVKDGDEIHVTPNNWDSSKNFGTLTVGTLTVGSSENTGSCSLKVLTKNGMVVNGITGSFASINNAGTLTLNTSSVTISSDIANTGTLSFSGAVALTCSSTLTLPPAEPTANGVITGGVGYLIPGTVNVTAGTTWTLNNNEAQYLSTDQAVVYSDANSKIYSIVSGAVNLTDVTAAGTVNSIYIGPSGTLEISEVLTSQITTPITGTGTIRINVGASNYFATSDILSSTAMSGFKGTVEIASGRYNATTEFPSDVSVSVKNGGQMYIHGGTWKNAFTIAGNGWSPTDATEAGYSVTAAALRLAGGATISGSITISSGNDVYGKIGNMGDETGTISGSLIGNSGFAKVANGTIVLTKPTTQCSGLTGKVTVNGGTLKIGNSDLSAGATVSVGDAIEVVSGTLRVQTSSARTTTFSADDKIKFTTPITLDNGATMHVEDGTTAFSSLTVADGATATANFEWQKGWLIQSLNGASTSTLTLAVNRSDASAAYLGIDDGSFKGTLKINNNGSNSANILWFSPKGDALEEATLVFGGDSSCSTYMLLRGDAKIGNISSTGTKLTAIYGDDITSSTLTIGGGTIPLIADNSTASSTGSYPPNLIINGDVTITTAQTSNYSGTATLNTGATLKVAKSDGNIGSTQVLGASDSMITTDASGDDYTIYTATAAYASYNGTKYASVQAALDVRAKDENPGAVTLLRDYNITIAMSDVVAGADKSYSQFQLANGVSVNFKNAAGVTIYTQTATADNTAVKYPGASLDENGILPYHWYDFNGQKNSKGVASLGWENNGTIQVNGTGTGGENTAMNGVNTWGDTELSFGSGDWSVVLVGKLSTTANGVVIDAGASYNNNAMLFSSLGGTTPGIKIASSGKLSLSANVSDATSAFHQYALTKSGTTYTLYVDGIQAAQQLDCDFSVGQGPWQLGGVYGGGSLGENDTGYVLDAFRVYHQALTSRQLLRSATALTTAPNTYIGGTGNWSTADSWSKGTVPAASENIGIIADAETTITYDPTTDLAVGSVTIHNISKLTVEKGENAGSLTATAIDDSASTNTTTFAIATGTASVTAGADTVVSNMGTGAITVGAGKKISVPYSASSNTMTVSATGYVKYTGTASSAQSLATLTKAGATVELTGTAEVNGEFGSTTDGTKMICNGTITTTANANEVKLAKQATSGKNTFEITGGTFTLQGRVMPSQSSDSTAGSGTVIISGGTLASSGNGFFYAGGAYGTGSTTLNISGGSFTAAYNPYAKSVNNNYTCAINVSGSGVFAPANLWVSDGNKPTSDDTATKRSQEKHIVSLSDGGKFNMPAGVPNWMPVKATSGEGVIALQSSATTIRSTTTVSSGATLKYDLGENNTLTYENASDCTSSKIVNNGTVAVASGTVRTCGYAGSGTIDVAEGAAFEIYLTSSDSLVTISALTGAGAVTIKGSGTVRLPNSNTFTGTITVEGGALALENTGAVGSASLVTVGASGTLVLGSGVYATSLTNVKFESTTSKLSLVDKVSNDGQITITTTFASGSAVPAYEVVDSTFTSVGEVSTTTVGTETTIKYTPPVSGIACWYDFTFTNTITSVGQNKGALTRDDSNGLDKDTSPYTTDGDAIYTAIDAYMTPSYNGTSGYPTAWSASAYATMPKVQNAVLMAFGTHDAGSIALIVGDTNKNEIILARTTGGKAYSKLATMTVPHAFTTKHLYSFCKTDKKISIYLDATLWSVYTSDSSITFGAGFQLGSLHGGISGTGFAQYGRTCYNAETEHSTVGVLRMFDAALGPQAIKALAAEFTYVSPNGSYSRTLDNTSTANWVSEDTWTKVGTEDSVAQPVAESAVTLMGVTTTEVTVNLSADTTYESIDLEGDTASTLTIKAAAENAHKIKANGLVTISAPVKLEYAAIDIAGVPLTLTENGSIQFDLSGLNLGRSYVTTYIPLTGVTSADYASRITVPTMPTAVTGRTATFGYDTTTQTYGLSVTVTDVDVYGTVNKTGTWGADGVITWTAGETEIDEPDWSLLTSAPLVVSEGGDYTLTYPSTSVPSTIVKRGTGTLTIAAGNNGKTYQVNAGTLKFSSMSNSGKATITVNAGGTFDFNGGSGYDPNLAITLNGGSLVNNGSDRTVNQRQFSSITLTADSTVGGTKNLYYVSNGYDPNTLELNGHTLTKTGSNVFGLCNTTIQNGTFYVAEGVLDFAYTASTISDNATLAIGENATLRTNIGMSFTDTTKWSTITGAVEVANGCLQLGDNKNGAKGEYKFGKSISVASGQTLKLHIWTTRAQSFNRADKAILTTPVTLNNAYLYTQDGAYYFDSITVTGSSRMTFNYNKSWGIGSLNGEEGTTLTLARESSESYKQYFPIDGGSFKGTLVVNNSDGSATADFWLSPKSTALAEATVSLQGSGRPTYIVLRDDATIGSVIGDNCGGIFGDAAAAHTLTLKGGTVVGAIKDVAEGKDTSHPLSVTIAGTVTLEGANTYSGATTIADGGKLIAKLGAGISDNSTITIANGGKLQVDMDDFADTVVTTDAYHFSGTLPDDALEILHGDTYPWLSIGTSGDNLGKVVVDESKLPLQGLHITKMLPKHTSKTVDRDANGRDSGWIELTNYGPTVTNLANFKIVRSNLGKKVKSSDDDLGKLLDYELAVGASFRVYTSEEYPTAEDYGGKGKEVAWFKKNASGVVEKLDAYADGALMVVPTKVNPKKYPMVRLYDCNTSTYKVIDEVIVPCDIDDNMIVEIVPSTTALKRRILFTDGTRTEYGPDVASMYGVKDVKGDLALLNTTDDFAPAGADYPVTLPINPFMTDGKALDANKITGVTLEYRVFDPSSMTTETVALTSRELATTAETNTYGKGCTLWTGSIPASAMQAGKLVQFRAKITDNGGNTWTAPRFLNPDLGYEWYGVVVKPELAETPTTDGNICTNDLQTFLMFIDDTNKAQMDTDVDAQTLANKARLAVYDTTTHTYYDNVRIDLRGQTSKSFYKKSHGLRFSKVAPLVCKDPFTGESYETRKTSFIAEYGDPAYLRQTISLRMMREAGIKAPFDWPVRLYLNGSYYQLAFHSCRFSDEAVEDFYGLNKYGYSYKNVEQLTSSTSAEKKTPDDDNESDRTVLNAYAARFENETDATALKNIAMTNFNVAAWINYLAATRVTQEGDDVWTNLGLYINKYDAFFNPKGDDLMMPLAYDQNLSFGQWYYGDDTTRGRSGIVATNDTMKSHPFYGGKTIKYYKKNGTVIDRYNRGMEVILQNATYRNALARRIRTLSEQFLGAQDATKEETPIWNWLVAYTNAITADVSVDQEKWLYSSKVVDTASNIWVWDTALGFNDAIDDLWTNYIVPRRKHLYDTHAAKNAGKEGYPTAVGYATGASAGIPETQTTDLTTLGNNIACLTNVVDGAMVLTNALDTALDVSNWKMTGYATGTLPAGAVIPAKGYLVFVKNVRTYVNSTGFDTTKEFIVPGATFDTDQNYLTLADANGNSVQLQVGGKTCTDVQDAVTKAQSDDQDITIPSIPATQDTLTVAPGSAVTIANPQEGDANKITVSYTMTDNTRTNLSELVGASVNAKGTIVLAIKDDLTDDQKAVLTPKTSAMTGGQDENKKDRVSIDIGTPVPGLFYVIHASTENDFSDLTDKSIKSGDAVQAKSTDTHTVSITNDQLPKGSNVIFFKVEVKATK